MPNFKILLAAATISLLPLAAASTAHAVPMMVDPGTPGQQISELQVTVTQGDLGPNNDIHFVFDMMKHVEFRNVTTVDILVPMQNTTVPQINGDFYLTDMFHMEIPGTRRMFTIFPFPGPPFFVFGPDFQPVVFHDFHIEFDGNPFPTLLEEPNNITLRFDGDVVVGIWRPIPEPGALAILGLGLFGLGLIRRQKRVA